jgi:hypothetical protein
LLKATSLAITATSLKFQLSAKMILKLKCGFVGRPALQRAKERARQVVFNFDEEVVWSGIDYDNLPGLRREKTYTPST